MYWALTDLTGRVISVGNGSVVEEKTAGCRLHDISQQRFESVMHGEIPMAMALVPDEDIQATRIRDNNPLPVEWRDRCTLLGRSANPDVWGAILCGVDVSLLGKKHLLVWDWRYNQNNAIHKTFPWDQWHRITQRYAPDDIVFVIDSHWEAPNPNVHFGPLGAKLQEHGVPRQQIINWNNTSIAFEQGVTININYVLSCGQVIHMEDPTPDASHHFIFLARQPRALRVLAACRIIEKNLQGYGHMSCGANSEFNDPWIRVFVPEPLWPRFPIILDRQIPQSDGSQYDISDKRIWGAALNVIGETSQDIPLTKAKESDWFDPFVSEKTTKAFRMGQLPIWMGVKNLVQTVRDMDLDVYDDVIDHGYDIIDDPYERVVAVVDQLERFCNMPLSDIDEIRRSIWPRILENKYKLERRIIDLYPSMGRLLTQHLTGLLNT